MAANDWREYEVSELCELIVDCVNKTAPKVDYETPYKMLRTTNVRHGVIDTQNCKYVEEHVFEKWTRRSKVLKGDILLTREAPIGEVGRITVDDNLFLGQRLMQYRVDPSRLDSKFLLYSFLSPYLQHQFYMHEGTGSVVSHIRVGDCLKFKIPTPPLSEQKSIANILGSLDDKIELNRQMNETLETMAQALFKSWFVDFDPVIDNALAAGNAIPDEFFERAEQRKGIEKKDNSDIQDLFPDEFEFTEDMGWIPKGWKLINFGEFCDIKKGKNITKSTVAEGSVPVVAGGLNPAYYHNKSNVEGPVITVSASGANAGFINLYYQDIWASDCSYINESMSPFIFTTYSFLKYYQDKVFGLQHGAVQPHVYPKDLSRLNFIDSNEGVKIAIEKNLVSYYKKVKFNEELIETLTKLRDTLLPKLMSGELRIPDAEALVDEVL